ncbi:MAG: hypothetical protein PVG07_00100 [Acidobacteriota bacterium]|jgi:hypothetical protein
MITIERSSKNGFFTIDGLDYHQNHYTIEYDNEKGTDETRNFSLRNIFTGNKIVASRGYAEITDVNSWGELMELLNEVGALKNNDVAISDQTSPVVINPFNTPVVSSTSTGAVAIGEKDVTVASITSFAVGQHLTLFSPDDNRFYLGEILAINGSVISADTPFDFDFPAGSYVIGAIKNMNVNGSITPVAFGLRNPALMLGTLETTFDVTRLMFVCTAASAVDLSKFGDIVGGLTKGIVIRKIDGTYRNILNAKTNGDLANIMYDFNVQAASNPAIGQDGFTGRLTFAGQNKIGVAIRLEAGEDLQVIIQDDLSTLTSFYIIAEGHEVVY